MSEPTNTITYIGSESGFERLTSLLKTLDIEDRQYVTRIVKLKYIHVGEMGGFKFLETLSSLPGFGADKDKTNPMSNFVYDPQTNSVIISTQKQYIDQILDIIAAMDTSIFDQFKVETIRLKYTFVARVVQLVASMMSTQAGESRTFPPGGFYPSEDMDLGITSEVNKLEGSSSGGNQGISGTTDKYPQTYKWAVAPDTSQNAIVVFARAQEMEMIKKIVSQLDKPYPQIKIDVQIVELTHTADQQYKLSYVTKDGKFVQGGGISGSQSDFTYDPANDPGQSGSNTSSEFLSSLVQSPDLSGKTGVFLIYNTLTSNVAAFGSSLNSTLSKINGRVVANPTMVAAENSPVNFNFTTAIPYLKTANLSGSNSSMEYDTVDDGYTVNIIPHFKDDYIVMNLQISASQVTGFTQGSNPVPIQSQRVINSEIKCKDGVPIILGGMVKSSESSTAISVPIISKIPIIGNLFKDKSKKQDEFEVVMVITPTILDVE